MKKIIIVAITLLALTSCRDKIENTQTLQEHFDVVYPLDTYRFICIDSSKNVYDIGMDIKHQIIVKIKIK
jgi:hypothetical protein